jgi:hypothetical protein
MSFLSKFSGRNGDNSISKARTIIGGIVHASLHGAAAVLSVLYLHVFSGSSEFSLGLVFVLSGVLTALASFRFFGGLGGRPEGINTIALRNLLSTVLLAAFFAALGQNDVDNRALNRDILLLVVGLTCLAKLGDVLANKLDPWAEDDENKDIEFGSRQLLTWLLIGSSLVGLLFYKSDENTTALSFNDIREGLLIGAISVLGMHLILNPLNMAWEKCHPDTQMIPLTRNPLIRHLTTSTGISFLAYALGYGVARDEKYTHLLSSLCLYIIADVTGRGVDVVAL